MINQEQFRTWADSWHGETDALSNPSRITGNETYLQIIALGRAAIPFILRDLQERGGDWYKALRTLSNANPVPPEHEGYPAQMDDDWLAWGRQQGYIA